MKHLSVDRRHFIELVVALGLSNTLKAASRSDDLGSNLASLASGRYRPGRIPNEYSLFPPEEKAALEIPPAVKAVANGALIAQVAGHSMTMRPGEQLEGWRLLGVFTIEETPTAIFEKHVSHRGLLVYVTEQRGHCLRFAFVSTY